MACLAAVVLGDTLKDLDGEMNLLPREFQGRLAERMKFPWETALTFDFQFPGTIGERPELTPEAEKEARYVATLRQLAGDPEVIEALLLSSGTFDKSRLHAPALAAKVERHLESQS